MRLARGATPTEVGMSETFKKQAGIAAIVSRLNKEIVGILNMPDIRKQLSEKGYEPVSSTPEQFGVQIATEQVKWASLVRQINLRLD
jgi:tripartite-type tricarboxylate transporter receptor subunit TctC